MVQIQKGMRSGVCEALEAFVALLKATESALEQLIVERTQQRTERGLKALGAVCLLAFNLRRHERRGGPDTRIHVILMAKKCGGQTQVARGRWGGVFGFGVARGRTCGFDVVFRWYLAK